MFRKFICIIIVLSCCSCALGCGGFGEVDTYTPEFQSFLELPEYTEKEFSIGFLASEPQFTADPKAPLLGEPSVECTIKTRGHSDGIRYQNCSVTVSYKLVLNYTDHTTSEYQGSETFLLDYSGTTTHTFSIKAEKEIYEVDIIACNFQASGSVTRKTN